MVSQAVMIHFPSIEFPIVVAICIMEELMEVLPDCSFLERMLLHFLPHPIFYFLSIKDATVILVPLSEDLLDVIDAKASAFH